MGTKLAPSYANIFMGELEEKIVSSSDKQPLIWLRFIDDIFTIWPYDLSELIKFRDHLNEQHRTIKFTMEYSSEKIVFLDTWVKKSVTDTKLEVELYTKPTDTHNYLHFKSYHPGHTKRGGPYGQFLRVRRNYTKIKDFDYHSQDMVQHYIERGYPKKLVLKAREKAKMVNRDSLLNPDRQNSKNKQSNLNIVPLVLTHHPSNKQIQKIIMDNWGILDYSDLCKEILPEKPLFATRRGTNVKDILIHSRMNPHQQPQISGSIEVNPWEPCSKTHCNICPMIKTKKTRCKVTKLSIDLPANVDCQTTNVVYLLTCSVCNKQYVGETKRAFHIRYKEHQADIRHKRDKPVANHIAAHLPEMAKITPNILEVINKDPDQAETTKFRQRREVHWIYTFRSLAPEGLNTLS